MVGLDAPDDAGVYRLSDDLAIVQTVDFFTPVVDDPYDYGRIAAANALSDIYAMGAEPRTALQLVSWPRDELGLDVLGRVIEGGSDVLDDAGCRLIGGHSIDDPEPKYGFAVTGVAHPGSIVTVGGSEEGDTLVLTKPLGTGIVSTAIKHEKASAAQAAAAVAAMVELNRAPSVAMQRVGVNAATDVTGFGLLGHLLDMTQGAELRMSDIPVLDGVRALADAGQIPGGTRRNLAAVVGNLDAAGIDETDRLILADAQTNGGLLIAVASERESELLVALSEEGVAGFPIGRVTSGTQVVVR